ncbi:hypothetical protein EV356DRAFT_571881 [Viridothelium virens]|uniref:Uncharacterized protein n=1 Tax=Viridothelium virens TaxID=1048519 RepID=A0A6A6GRM9_VIRVR|nr:hypothetical protein EV356DRAFT_571881 [Viridothelium virens]
MQEANNSDDMWAKADKKCLVGHRSTANTKRVLAFLKAEVEGLQNADTELQGCTHKARDCFQLLLKCVLKLESLINTAAKLCFPAALACAGVIVLSQLYLNAIN